MRKLVSFRVLVYLVGTLVLAATAVIGASLPDSTVTSNEPARLDGELGARSRPAVNIEPVTGSTDDTAAPTVLDTGETPTSDGVIAGGLLAGEIATHDLGALDLAGAATPDDGDAGAGFATSSTETGVGNAFSSVGSDVSPVNLPSDGSLGGGDGAPSAGSATGMPSGVGPGNSSAERGGDTESAARVPEASTLVLVAVPLLAALIARSRR